MAQRDVRLAARAGLWKAIASRRTTNPVSRAIGRPADAPHVALLPRPRCPFDEKMLAASRVQGLTGQGIATMLGRVRMPHPSRSSRRLVMPSLHRPLALSGF